MEDKKRETEDKLEETAEVMDEIMETIEAIKKTRLEMWFTLLGETGGLGILLVIFSCTGGTFLPITTGIGAGLLLTSIIGVIWARRKVTDEN